MDPIKPSILHLTPFFSPNIGGVETHLLDLTQELDNLNYHNYVLTYSPLTTANTKYKSSEFIWQNTYIRRFKWFGYNLFHQLEKSPLLNFLYLTPYLLFRTVFWLIRNSPKIETIHSHGINAAIVGIIIQKIFKIKKHITSIYSTYDNVPQNQFTNKILKFVLNQTDIVLTQSNQSVVQLKKLGVNHSKISRYHHWIDTDRFIPNSKLSPQNFTVLFVGRMIPQKNALILAKIAQKLPKINFNFVGTGPDYQKIKLMKLPNITLLGDVPYHQLHLSYQNSTILCIPSKYSEGWGRVIAEAISCRVPVICTNLGGTIEAANTKVGIFVKPTFSNLFRAILRLYQNPQILMTMQNNCRPYAKQHYSSKNIKFITRHY